MKDVSGVELSIIWQWCADYNGPCVRKEQSMAVVRDQNGQPLKIVVYSDYI